MTELIDVSSAQAGINMSAVRQAGVGGVIVKAGGFNVTPMYVAPYYAQQVDAARAAGLKIGHYWLVGSGDPVTEANFFCSHLHALDKENDVLVLDDERLDGNPAFWTDGQASTFLKQIMKNTGMSADQIWLYMGEANDRANAWPTCTAMGVRWWIAVYGSDNGMRQASPDVPWTVHQYTSQGRIAGFTVDRSYSPLSIDELFGGTVALTSGDIANIAQAVWKQAIKDSAGDIHQAQTYLVWGWQAASAAAKAASATAPATTAGVTLTTADVVTALKDPAVLEAIAEAVAKKVPTKFSGVIA